LTSPGCKISFTDTDGLDPLSQPGPDGWVGTTGPAGSGIDHETIGGGPYHTPIPPRPPGTVYPNAVYYCSQDLGPAFCLRSDDGGANWGPPTALNTTQCGGLHGHIKVSLVDGTVYVPNNNCGGQGAVVVSEDNGITWSPRTVHTATETTVAATHLQDPAVAIDAAGKVYFAMASGDSTAAVATSTDRGLTWNNLFDVGAVYGLQNISFPAAVAGDAGRAAVSFYGTTTPGNTQSSTFNGIWHLYVAHTFDGGQTWTTTDATPNSPVQRGCIWQQGGVNICRNLLDFFDMTVDKQGRVQVGWVSGCTGFDCAHSPDTGTFHGNGYTATAVITRQSSGRRLFAANDPLSATSVPGMPWLTQRRVGSVVHLGWSEGDDGNSPITSYQILRGIASNGETLLATVPATQTTYDDPTATDITKTYYYKVLAINGVGASCGNNEVAAPYLGDTCNGLIVQRTPPGHPEQSAQGAAPASLAIDYIAVGEPPGTSNFMFQMKVTNLSTIPPDSRWRIVWNTYASSGQQFFVGMSTGTGAPTFQYGEVMTGAIPPVVGLIGVPIETVTGTALPASNFNVDGTITIFVPKSVVGNPPPGYLLGAVNGRTFTGDTPETVTLERSTLLVDHTFVKAQRDNGSPAATYTVVGNTSCIVPASAVSRKTHGTAGTFDVNLPLIGTPGIECRTGGATGDHKVVVTFATPVTVSSATVTPGAGGTASVSSTTVSGNQVTVNLTNVSNAQTLTVNLLGVTDGPGTGTANVTVPMSVLLGDTTANGSVNSSDISQTKAQSGTVPTASTFRTDVTVNGLINSSDISTVKSKSGTALP
jgi:BNR repeat-like domain